MSGAASALPGASRLPVPGAERGGGPFRVMVVDDSAVIRGLLVRALESDQQIQVIASAGNGSMALSALERHDAEIVVLDIEMPVMDGLTALPRIIAARPGVKVIIASTLTRRNADISLKALAAGAADYITKPGASALTSADEFKRELLAKVKALGEARRRGAGSGAAAPASPRASAAVLPKTFAPAPPRRIVLRPVSQAPVAALAIGSSTGGPQALFAVLGALRGRIAQPIFVTQHMPATFTTILAEHIGRVSGWPSSEAVDGEKVQPGRVYIAPGDYHMTIDGRSGAERTLRLSKAPAENFCRPSVDPMLRSLAHAYGANLLAVILTGMGQDGLKGGEAVAAAGGTLLAQDEATSVVWGMPGAVALAGLCSAVLPLGEIGTGIARLAARS